MSAILSADDLNDFISPGVACIKPVETLPKQVPKESHVSIVCHRKFGGKDWHVIGYQLTSSSHTKS